MMIPECRYLLMLGILALSSTPAVANEVADRLVTIGGAVTETVYLLGAGASVVAVDETSLYPPEAQQLPNVGYMRTLAAEPILALKPTRILYSDDAGPPETLKRLRDVGVPMTAIPSQPTVTGTYDKIRAVAKALERGPSGEALVNKLRSTLDGVAGTRRTGSAPRVLFVMQFDEGSVLAAGEGTAADSIIRLAGGANAASDFQRYKPMGAEALLAAAPDVVLTMTQTLAPYPRQAAVFDLPVLRLTPAARDQRLVALDGPLLLGFGPRLGEAVAALAAALYAP